MSQPAPLVHDAKAPVWSLCMIGLCIFTVCVVTGRIPLADVGVAVGALGLVTQRGRLRFPGPAWLFAIFVLWAWATGRAAGVGCSLPAA